MAFRQDNERKRKRSALTFSQKIEIVERINNGESSATIMKMFNIGKSTFYDIKSAKLTILQNASLDCHSQMGNIKTFHKPKSDVIDAKLYEWFLEKHSDGMSISGPMLIAKAKSLNDELNLKLDCKFSNGWLRRFKDRHAIRPVSTAEEIKSADNNPTTKFCSPFASILQDEGLTQDQIYNCDEMGLNWKCLPKKMLTGREEDQAEGFNQNKERITILLCANASGTHKMNPLVIGKSARHRAFKGLEHLPVEYKSQNNAWMDRIIFKEWFFQQFVPEVRSHFKKLGKRKDTKCLLFLDKCDAHPCETELVSDCGNIYAVHFPPNVTPLIQPMEQRVIANMKCYYTSQFMMQMLQKGSNPLEFQRNFSIKDAVFLLRAAWDSMKSTILINAWDNLLQQPNEIEANSLLKQDVNVNVNFTDEGVQTLNETLKLACNENILGHLTSDDVAEWVNADSDSEAIVEFRNDEDFEKERNLQELTNEKERNLHELTNEDLQFSDIDELAPGEETWTDIEEAIKKVVRFMEKRPTFSYEDCNNARMVQNCLSLKKFQEEKQNEMRKKLRMMLEDEDEESFYNND